MAYYIGVMSGTSLDGIDIVLMDITSASHYQLIHAQTTPFPAALKASLSDIVKTGQCHLLTLGQLDIELGIFISDAIKQLLIDASISADQVIAIGSHGHTLFHAPDACYPFSFQIGNGHTITEQTGITTISDFRQRDMAAGGQGAPLVPAFHHAVFSNPEHASAVINIGGIANITLLASDQEVIGFDTGPGNTLLDIWIAQHHHQAYDENGQWAATGDCHARLLQVMLSDPYFQRVIPKSTGREYFNSTWIERCLNRLDENIKPEDVQATLLSLTTQSIVDSLNQHCPSLDAVFICGGGAHNHYLMQQLQQKLSGVIVSDTSELGLSPDWVEACAFAWLAYQTEHDRSGNLPAVTGAKHPVILGTVCKA